MKQLIIYILLFAFIVLSANTGCITAQPCTCPQQVMQQKTDWGSPPIPYPFYQPSVVFPFFGKTDTTVNFLRSLNVADTSCIRYGKTDTTKLIQFIQ